MLPYPVALVADDDPINLAFLTRTLERSAWRVLSAVDGRQAADLAIAEAPHLIVLDINMPELDGWEAAARIRRSNTPAAGAPIVAFTTQQLDEHTLRARGFDGWLAKPCTPEMLVDAAARWRPDGELAGVERLAQIFDVAELDALMARLRDQLEDALSTESSALAHRLAGAAGTLGFAAVTESWLALSEGDLTVRERARDDARRAIAAIDRHLSSAQSTQKD